MSTKTLNSTPNPNGELIPLHDKKANRIIRNYTLASTGSGIIPFAPISGTAITAIQVLMIRELCKLYQVPFTRNRLSVIINSALGSAATRIVALMAKVIPGISAPMKGLSGGAIAGLYTAIVGEFYKVHFQRGGRLEDADIDDIVQYFLAEYKSGAIGLSSISSPSEILKRIKG